MNLRTDQPFELSKCSNFHANYQPPFKTAAFDIMDREGISHERELIDIGLKMGFVTRSEAWFTIGSIRLGQERQQAQEFLLRNSDIAAMLEKQIRSNTIFFSNEAQLFGDEELPPEE